MLLCEDRNPVVGNGIYAYEVKTIKVLNEETPNTLNGVDSGAQSKIAASYPLAKVIEKSEKLLSESKKLIKRVGVLGLLGVLGRMLM